MQTRLAWTFMNVSESHQSVTNNNQKPMGTHVPNSFPAFKMAAPEVDQSGKKKKKKKKKNSRSCQRVSGALGQYFPSVSTKMKKA